MINGKPVRLQAVQHILKPITLIIVKLLIIINKSQNMCVLIYYWQYYDRYILRVGVENNRKIN